MSGKPQRRNKEAKGNAGGELSLALRSKPVEERPPTGDEINKIETAVVLDAQKLRSPCVMPYRPGYGMKGSPVTLLANYFNLIPETNVVLYLYSVTIFSDADQKSPMGKKAKRVVEILLEDHFSTQQANIASDFKSNLVSQNNLNLKESEYTVVYRSEQEQFPKTGAMRYKCQVMYTGSIAVADLLNHLTSTKAVSTLDSRDIIRALNIVLGHHAKSNPGVATVGGNRHFDLTANTQESLRLGIGLKAIRGYLLSVRAATARLLVNVQVKNNVFFDEGPLDRIMADFLGANPTSNKKLDLHRFLKKLAINITHLSKNEGDGRVVPRVKIIHGLATRTDGKQWEKAPIINSDGAGAKDVKFFLDMEQSSAPSLRSSYVTVFEYFHRAHGIKIRRPDLPVINVGTAAKPSYLPAELCEVRPGQPYCTKLSESETQRMIRFSVRPPDDNKTYILTSGTRLLGFTPPNCTMKSFGIDIGRDLITVSGRQLPAPNIQYANRTKTPNGGKWNMLAAKLSAPAHLNSWTTLRISVKNGRSYWKDNAAFINKLKGLYEQFGALGLKPNAPWMGKRSLSIRIKGKHPLIKGILVIIPEAVKTVIYNHVKYICDVEEGLVNVCVLDSKFATASPQHLANVGLKFNMKLGGRNHDLDPSQLGFIRDKETMIVGIDVTHPAPGDHAGTPSIAGIVASIDARLGQWPAALRIQTAKKEMVDGLEDMFMSRLLLWKERNTNLPANILVYRDGVSESQYDTVLNDELPQLRAACATLYSAREHTSEEKSSDSLPRITIVIVGKRHNTRFYPASKAGQDKQGNPMNGTVVDRGITEARKWDFFLQAHTALQGTARPTHYHVIYDEIFRAQKNAPGLTSADALEDLTHNMCYLFGRATTAVRVCPPVYYADLLCTRARCYLSGLPNSQTVNKDKMGDMPDGTEPRMPPGSLWERIRIHQSVKNKMFYV